MVKIVTDSTADVSRELARELNVSIAPLTVAFGTEEYRDGIDLSPAEFFEKLSKSPVMPTTSQVTVGAFIDVFREALTEKDDELLGLFISHRLSGTYQSATIARNNFPRRSICLVDSGTGSFGMQLLLREAARMRDAGSNAQEIAAALEKLKKRLNIYVALETLKYLQKGGRLSATAAVMGALLNVKPVLQIQDGKISIAKKVRGNFAAYDWMVQRLKEEGMDPGYKPCIGFTQCPELFNSFSGRMRVGLGLTSWDTCEIGVVIGTHSGPGCVGVAYIQK